MIRIKESTKNHEDQLWRWLNYVDATGKKGISELKDIKFVKGEEAADVGVSWHGAPVEGVPPKKCILMKNEPPIYNVFFGRDLSDEKYTKLYPVVMSSHKINSTDIYYNIPRYEFKYVNEFFDSDKREFMCMILRHKKWSYRINSIDYKNRKFNKRSLLRYREQMDKFFCKNLGKNHYHSYGGPWVSPSYQGAIPGGGKWEVFAKYRFCFCPENSRFNGYVTEKLIQPMCFGCIPVYMGAPDVSEYAPEGTFIDASKFNNKELLDHIKYMTNSEITKYKRRILKYITSNESKAFSSVTFAKKFMEVVEEVIK